MVVSRSCLQDGPEKSRTRSNAAVGTDLWAVEAAEKGDGDQGGAVEEDFVGNEEPLGEVAVAQRFGGARDLRVGRDGHGDEPRHTAARALPPAGAQGRPAGTQARTRGSPVASQWYYTRPAGVANTACPPFRRREHASARVPLPSLVTASRSRFPKRPRVCLQWSPRALRSLHATAGKGLANCRESGR